MSIFNMLAVFLYFPTRQLFASRDWLVTTHDSFLTGSWLPLPAHNSYTPCCAPLLLSYILTLNVLAREQ